MTNKLWFQAGVGALLLILIIRFFLDIRFLFDPLLIILKTVFIPLLIAGVLFYITEPVQRFLEKKGMPRWGSILTLLGIVFGIIFFFVSIIGPPMTNQINELIKNSPQIAKELTETKDSLLSHKADLPETLENWADDGAAYIQDKAVAIGEWLLGFIQSMFQAVLLMILVPFFYIFMLKDHEKFAPYILQFFTGMRKTWLEKTLVDIDDALRSYIQGQFIISAILATMLFAGYSLIGLKYALLLSLFALFMNLIPFIGPWIAVVPALIVALLQDPSLVIWVAVVTLVAQQTDSNVITPNIMGKSLAIHPLTVITLILAAGNIGGFLAILIVIPTYAVLKAIIRNIYEYRQHIAKAATKEV